MIGVVRQKPTHCVVMGFDTGTLSIHPMNVFEVVPKNEVP